MKSKLGPITKRELKFGVRLSVEKMVEGNVLPYVLHAYRASLTAGHSSIVGFGRSAESALNDLEEMLKENLGT